MERSVLFLSLTLLIVLSHFSSQYPDMFDVFSKKPSGMILIVGLGNPGKEYAENRHNVGFMAVEKMVDDYNFAAFRSKFQGLISEGTIAGQKAVLLKPQTYMNESGQSVAKLIKFYKIPPEKVIVFHDELDLNPGQVRVRKGGGNAGHNGLKSIQAHLGSPDFWRVRIGIGHPGDRDRVSDYVLSNFAKADQDWLEPLLPALSKHIALLLEGRDNEYMSKVAMDTQ